MPGIVLKNLSKKSSHLSNQSGKPDKKQQLCPMAADKDIRVSFRWLQALLWVIFFMALILYATNKYGFAYSLYSTGIAVLCYLLAVYGNSSFLMPRFFRKGKMGLYLLCSAVFIAAVVWLKAWLEYTFLLPVHKLFFTMQMPHLSLGFLTVVTAFLFGGFLNTARNYIGLLKKQEEMKTRQLATELALLKQQVQPHFLFNTLNNIYSLANTKSDDTKIAIARLADMMRYFTDEAPKEKLPLQTEIGFISNYISLEQLRMVHPVKLTIDFAKDNVPVPPMLLMPFVENLFKHGVDKTRDDNEAVLKLAVANNWLQFSVCNRLCAETNGGSGFGLANLRKRLHLLYGDGYVLRAGKNGVKYEAYMEIPI
jgi:sensor histidine kinase YesM